MEILPFKIILMIHKLGLIILRLYTKTQLYQSLLMHHIIYLSITKNSIIKLIFYLCIIYAIILYMIKSQCIIFFSSYSLFFLFYQILYYNTLGFLQLCVKKLHLIVSFQILGMYMFFFVDYFKFHFPTRFNLTLINQCFYPCTSPIIPILQPQIILYIFPPQHITPSLARSHKFQHDLVLKFCFPPKIHHIIVLNFWIPIAIINYIFIFDLLCTIYFFFSFASKLLINLWNYIIYGQIITLTRIIRIKTLIYVCIMDALRSHSLF